MYSGDFCGKGCGTGDTIRLIRPRRLEREGETRLNNTEYSFSEDVNSM